MTGDNLWVFDGSFLAGRFWFDSRASKLNNPHAIFEFGLYRLEGRERRLLKGVEPIPLQPKVFDTLLLLVENGPALPNGAPIAAWLDGGRTWLLIAVVTVWAYDSGAYAVGRTWGRRHFAVHLSPGKTLEGVAGGLIAAVVVSGAVLWSAGQPIVGGLVLGLLVGLAAQAGDLAESMLKRAASVKDSSNLIPGHGGMLDRVDSILFAAPAVYFYLLILGVGR